MKLKHIAAFLMLFAIGCSSQPGSESPAPTADAGDPASVEAGDAATTVEPETETLLASTTVSFDVTGMK